MIIKEKSIGKKVLFVVILIILIALAILPIILREQSETEQEIDNLLYSLKPTSDSPEEFTLPVVVIDTNGQKLDETVEKEDKELNDQNVQIYKSSPRYKANFKLYNPKKPEKAEIDEKIELSLRGQSSLSKPKKQYYISFENEQEEEKKVGILGMPEHSKWIINGAYMDKSLIRNYLAYTLAAQVMDYAPRVKFVEVFVKTDNEELSYDKHYAGVYLIVEKIERDENRINIRKADERYKDVSFIIARDKIKSNDRVYDTYWEELQEDYIMGNDGIIRMRSVIKNIYPGNSAISEEYLTKVKQYINEFEGVLYSSEYKTSDKGYRNYIDVNSFIDMAMINEIFKNIDGCEVSTYFYKDIGGKLTSGPIWDFDLTLGNTTNEEVNEATGFRMVDTIWFNRLFQDSYFCDLYEQRYKELRTDIYTEENFNKIIDDAIALLGGATKRNMERWYPNSQISYEDEINNIKKFIHTRLNWMDENIKAIQRYEEILE